jgi:signal transduction histidine kinase/CheY-like chemotaxis protein
VALAICTFTVPIAHADTLRVAHYENPPTIFRNENNIPSGFWPELTEAVLGNLGYEIEYVDCLWSVCLEMLEANEIDLMPDIAYTPERASKFQFVEQPLLYSWFSIVVSESIEFDTLRDFEGKRIAVLANSIQERGITEYLEREQMQARLVWVSSMEGVLQAVAQGDADIGIVNKFISASDARDTQSTYIAQIPFGTYSLHFAAAPNMDPGFVDAINLEVYHQQTTFRSALQRAMQRWATLVPLPLPIWVLPALALSLTLLMIALVFVLILRGLVKKQTRSLTTVVADLEQQIIQRKQAEALAIESQKMDALGRLVGGVAHDFNNLLAVIQGNLELMPKTHNADPEFGEFRSAAIKATRAGATLVQDLLSFSRRAPLNPELVHTAHVLSGVHNMISRIFPANITVTLHVTDAVWPVRLDRGQLENALLNLSINAKDAMPQGGRLTLSCTNSGSGGHREDRQVHIKVSDTGSGMTDETRSKVFEPFFTTKEVGKGSGMGLAMVHGFVEQSGGRIAITSVLDVGTTVELTFPAQSNDKPVEPEEKSAFSGSIDPSQGTVLLVEDNEPLRQILDRQLRALGYSVLAVSSGAEALETLAYNQSFDLIMSDVMMPGPVQGPDLAKAVASLNRAIPIILITGYASENLNEMADYTNCIVLTKPISQSDLKTAISTHLSTLTVEH